MEDQNEIPVQLDPAYTIRVLAEMIAINSIVGNEGELAKYIHNELNSIGIDSQLVDVEHGRPNVYARIQGNRLGRHLHLNGHMDTVPVCEGWQMNPFVPTIKEGRMYGLGSCDMKAGLACNLTVMRAFRQSGRDFAGELSFSAVIDEEAYSKGAHAFLETEFAGCDAIILAEPNHGDDISPIPLGNTGKILYDITVNGRASHGFFPEMGINAIEEAARILTSLERLNMKTHPDFGKGKLCTLKITGGYQVYSVVVPDCCRFEINRMLVPGETSQGAVEDMQRLIEGLGLKAEVDVALKAPTYESFVLDRSEPILRIFDEAYYKVMKKMPKYSYETSVSDANVFSGEAGIPCLHIGPQLGNAHQPDEYVTLDSIQPACRIIAMTANRFLFSD